MEAATQRGVEDLILELLADRNHLRANQLREDFLALGEEMPVDSALAAEVLVEVEVAYGVRLKPTPESMACLRSVVAFAAEIVALAAVKQGSEGVA